MTFVLPNLPYAYNALEPAIDARTMEIHHTKHHQAYTTKLNEALEGLPFAKWSIEDLMTKLTELPQEKQGAVRNNGGGFYNHSLFWLTLAGEADRSSADPQGELAAAITAAFGSFDKFKELFEAKAVSQFGSGWAWLVASADGTLKVTSTPNQDNPLMPLVAAAERGTPILGLDVWEHAYYLNYQNRRPDYAKAFWSVVHWGRVSENYARAKVGKSVVC